MSARKAAACVEMGSVVAMTAVQLPTMKDYSNRQKLNRPKLKPQDEFISAIG
jgi:hypothetical protein